jgi:hypothetical protein
MLQMFQLFLFYVAISVFMLEVDVFSCSKLQVFYLDVAYVSQICCKCTFQMFHPFHIYVAFKCFMLHAFHVVRRARRREE